MSLHDEYARVTPYELTFQTRERAEALVESVRMEAEGRGADPESPHAFVTMGAVGAFIRELEGPDAPEGAVHQYGALAYHGVHFTTADCPLFLLSTHVARYLVEGVPGDTAGPPTPAGYLQFPQHLFWVVGGPDAPESVDGVFWTATRAGYLHSLLVTGIREDRPGMGIVMVPEAPLVDAGRWMEVDGRGDGSDYSSEIPGSEIDGLYRLATSGEILKLLGRFFAYAAAVPGGLHPGAGSGPVAEGEMGIEPIPSTLDYLRVTLDA